MKTLDIIVPVYNEEACLDKTMQRLLKLKETFKGKLNLNYIFVNDGSKDKTLQILEENAKKDKSIKVINFSRNFGHQMALSAGLDYSKGDYIAIIDGDLQDPPELIYDMYEKSLEGYDIVYGKRLKRKQETIFKKLSAWGFYRVLKSMCNLDIPTDTGDFRFITKDVREAFNQMREKHRFIRGMVPWTGFRSAPMPFIRDERVAGETKYPLSKMLKLAFDGIFSFSFKPIDFIFALSAILFIASLIIITAGFLTELEEEYIICFALTLVGSINLLAMGILGQYIGRIYDETRNRPLYIVKNTINF